MLLDEALRRTDARLLLIDPLMAFLSRRVIAASDQSVRRALLPLAQLAQKHRCAAFRRKFLSDERSRLPVIPLRSEGGEAEAVGEDNHGPLPVHSHYRPAVLEQRGQFHEPGLHRSRT